MWSINGVTTLNARPGEGVEAVKSEQPISGYAEYMLWNYMMLAADCGLPIAIAIYDPRLGNWSSLRSILAVSEMRRLLLLEQFRYFYKFVARSFIAWRILTGAYAGMPEDWVTRIRFEEPAPLILDPESEVRYRGILRQLRWTTNKDAVYHMTGRDFTEVATELAAEEKMLEELGIKPIPIAGTFETPEPKVPAEDKPEDDKPDEDRKAKDSDKKE